MRQFALVGMAALALGACGKATALSPDSANPAHCIAAYNYGAYWLSMEKGNRSKVAAEIAKSRYEMSKVMASRQSAMDAKAESERLTRAFANDGKAMGQLYKECTKALQDDAEFKRQFPILLEAAKPLAATFGPSKG